MDPKVTKLIAYKSTYFLFTNIHLEEEKYICRLLLILKKIKTHLNFLECAKLSNYEESNYMFMISFGYSSLNLLSFDF